MFSRGYSERGNTPVVQLLWLIFQDPDSPLDSLSWLALHDAAEEEDLLNSFSVLTSLEDDVSTRAVELKKIVWIRLYLFVYTMSI